MSFKTLFMHDFNPRSRNPKEDQQLKTAILFFIVLAILITSFILLGLLD